MKSILLITLFAVSIGAKAQQLFIDHGHIEFECKMNVQKQMVGDFADEFKDKIAKFKTTYFDLYFKGNKTLYRKGRDSDDKMNFWSDDIFLQDIVYTDYNAGNYVKKKQVFDQAFLLSDSLLNVKWRITPDTREIAGFHCHKAVGRFNDSIYVVAFYTDEIVVTGGPMAFSGLPGMILGLALPRMSTTWFATKLELTEPSVAQLTPPAKGKKSTQKEMEAVIKKTVSDWGEWGKKFEIQAIL